MKYEFWKRIDVSKCKIYLFPYFVVSKNLFRLLVLLWNHLLVLSLFLQPNIGGQSTFFFFNFIFRLQIWGRKEMLR